jgi:chemotaxis receptor (MCP) glutamine deamidase CheD
MFTDTGVPALLQAVFDLGAERKRLIAKVVGAASLLDEKGFFKRLNMDSSQLCQKHAEERHE